MNHLPVKSTGFGWTPYAVLACVALWPTVGAAEAILSLGALASLCILFYRRFRHGTALLSREAWALITALFFCYWAPEFFSAFDAVNPQRAWHEVLVDLRYLPFLWLVAMAVARRKGRNIVYTGLGLITLFWAGDGLVQVFSGYSLGGLNTSDRLSGIFGAGNLKLGIVLATLSPFALSAADRKFAGWGWALTAVVLGVVILLAGSRASWLCYVLVLGFSGWRRFGGKRLLGSLLVGGVLAVLLAMNFSTQFEARIQRSLAVLNGNATGLDEALSYRLSLWSTATRVIADHPINGVGARGFRDVYTQYAAADDPWLSHGQQGALHAHQIVLEILTETGVIGLLLWLMGAALAVRAWQWAMPSSRQRAALPALALAVTVFPFNTHLAFYSTFWADVFLLLLALFAGSLFALEDDAAPID